MAYMNAEPFLTFNPRPEATPIGHAAGLLEDDHGGQVFIHGMLWHSWTTGDDTSKRLAAVSLWRMKAASAAEIGHAFGVIEDTIWHWHRTLNTTGLNSLTSEKRGPRGGSKLTKEVITRIQQLRASGLTLTATAAQTGVSEFSVRRAMKLDPATGQPPVPGQDLRTADLTEAIQEELPILPTPAPRTEERLAASTGTLTEAVPVFTPAAKIPYAGLLLALPALEATGLLSCVHQVYCALKPGFYGLNTTILEAVLRTLAGEPRAEGARRLKPADLGRILGLDRAPEVKTIRRKHQELAAQNHAVELLQALGRHHLASTEPTGEGDALGLLLYVDGHVRSYQGSKKIGKQYSTRLKYPVPASMETWVSDASGAPVFMVMAAPSKNLVGELRGLVPQLRALVGDQRRVLIGFDREGWSPALFEYLYEQGFDVLTWRKGSIPDLDPGIFRKARFTNQWGQDHEWKQAADTVVGVEVDAKARKNAEAAGEASDETGALVPSVGVTVDGMFGMRQISRIVAAGKQVRESTGEADRQIHLLTTNTTLSAGELIFHIGRRWRQENYFRYARQHFALDSHDTYQHTVDDVTRSVPNPAKEKAKQARDAAAAVVSTLSSVADAQMLRLNTPEPGETRVVSNAEVNQINAPVIKAEQALHKATKKWEKIPARLPLGEVNPGQLVLETEHKQLLHAVRMSAFNASMAMVADIRSHTGLRSVFKDANEFVRQALTGSGDLDPRTDGFLDVVLDPLPTRRETVALGEMCERLSETRTRYPGTDRVLRYRVKNHC